MAPVVHTSSGRLRSVTPRRACSPSVAFLTPNRPSAPSASARHTKLAAWDGVREAHTYGPAAMQGGNPVDTDESGPPEMSEDCLYLNVWTPATDDARRPVLVWLHGGAFLFSAGSQPLFNGARLAARGDVVVVTLNYRLGLFGFLRGKGVCGDGLDSTGNEGLLDQIAALEWVRDEIGGFGGDPHNVTVFGQSAGAISAALLTIMPRARGLVHKVIQQSGGVVVRHTPEAADTVMHRLLAGAGLTPAQASQLRDMPATALLDLQQRVTPRTGGVFYQPVADGDLIPADPFAAVAAGASRGIPLLCGTNLDETKFHRAIDPAVDTLDEAGLLARCRTYHAGHAERVIETYRAARQARGADASPPELWFAIANDHRYRAPLMRQAELHAVHTPQTYGYLFAWRSPARGGRLGAAHSMEMPFVFGRLDDPRMVPSPGKVQRCSGCPGT